VRVYVLDEHLEPVEIGERKVTLAVVAEKPEVVVLAPDPGGLYFTGSLHVHGDPAHVTVAVRTGEHVDVVLVGWQPGVHVVVGAHAPRVHIHGRAGFAVDDHGHGHERVDVKVKGNGGVDVKVKTPGGVDVKVKTHGGGPGVKAHGHGGVRF
jgi:hypothetical protein